MITTRLKIPLEDAEYTALLCVAGDELRNPVDQMRFILRQELGRRGLLVIETKAKAEPGQAVVKALATMPKTAQVKR